MQYRKKKSRTRREAVRWQSMDWWPGHNVGRMVGSGAVIQAGPDFGFVLVLGGEPRVVRHGEWIVRTVPYSVGARPVFVEILPDGEFQGAYDVMHDAA